MINLAFKNKGRAHYEPKVPPGPYSEMGLRVEAALVELEAVCARVRAKSHQDTCGVDPFPRQARSA